MSEVAFDRFYRHDELSELLRGFQEEHPSLVSVESIGKSYEDRDVWLVTITNSETGAAEDKPALWLEANIHASEVTGSAAALHLIHRLVSDHGADPKITRAVDTRTFYIVPRLNPDGAELALADKPRIIRSSVRPYPIQEQQDGLHREDIDGDGRILTMRVPDPNGPWKKYGDDPRLMVRRDPDEDGEGDYYRLLPEGMIRNYDGLIVKVAPPLEGLDLNRNFPMEWEPEVEQRGAGPFPTSEPEIRAEVQAIVDRLTSAPTSRTTPTAGSICVPTPGTPTTISPPPISASTSGSARKPPRSPATRRSRYSTSSPTTRRR